MINSNFSLSFPYPPEIWVGCKFQPSNPRVACCVLKRPRGPWPPATSLALKKTITLEIPGFWELCARNRKRARVGRDQIYISYYGCNMAVFQWDCIYGHGNLNSCCAHLSWNILLVFFTSAYEDHSQHKGWTKTGIQLDLFWCGLPAPWVSGSSSGLVYSSDPFLQGPASPPPPTPLSWCISSWSPCFALCWFPYGQAYMSWLICSWIGMEKVPSQQWHKS